ncbi:hypothetical protein ACTXT7_008149 [Hymenolepis weldensis]
MGQLLQQLWISGVASEKEVSFLQTDSQNDGSNSGDDLHFTELKLNGTPFCIPEWNKDNFLAAQYMIGRLVGVLSLVGWRLAASVNVYTSPYDKSLLIFEKDLVNYAYKRVALSSARRNYKAGMKHKIAASLSIAQMRNLLRFSAMIKE